MMKVIPLSEGSFTVDKTKQFVPFDITKDVLVERPTGSLLVEIQPFAVITSRDIIVLDTGLGFTNPGGTLQIHENLLSNNIDPGDVTKVLLTHLHKDHAGGIFQKGKDSALSFKNAVYYINKKEFDFALEKGYPSYTVADFKILKDSAQVIFLDDAGVIDGYIRYAVTGGHSPFHQVFWIEEEGETIFFGGDVAPQLAQMKNKLIAKYDYEGRKATGLRQQWWKQGEKEKWKFLFYHDIKTPTFTF